MLSCNGPSTTNSGAGFAIFLQGLLTTGEYELTEIDEEGKRVIERVSQGKLAPLLISVPTLSPPWRSEISFDLRETLKESTEPVVARRLLAEFLNPNLASVGRSYDPALRRTTFIRRTLIEEIYWQLADQLDQVRRCECGAFFFSRDPQAEALPSGRGPTRIALHKALPDAASAEEPQEVSSPLFSKRRGPVTY